MGGGSKKGGGGSQARAATEAAAIQAQAQREALEYLKDVDAVPRQYREDALAQLGNIYGVGEGGQQAQTQFIQGLEQNPLYQSILSGQEAGEEAILRQQAATGGLRSGTTQHALADYGTQLRNQALLQTYNQQVGGLQGLAGLPSNANQIAALTQGIGTTQAQGITGAAAARAQSQQQGFGNLLGLAGTGIAAYGAFSDPRLKTDIKYSHTENGVHFHTWKWNDKAKELFGLEGDAKGVLTTENPEYVIKHSSGYDMVDYKRLEKEKGVSNG